MNVITVIGAGWLGSPLAAFLSKNHTVFASKTTPEGVNKLNESHPSVNGFLFKFGSDATHLQHVLNEQDSDCVIGCFPPGFRKGKGADYAKHWKNLVESCANTNVKKIIMISSTAVYPDSAEIMTEDMADIRIALNDETFSDKARILLEAEESVIRSGIDYCVLRMSGLIGPDRHPARFISKLRKVSTLAPANMVHQIDAIQSIVFSVAHVHNEVLNVTTPYTVSKAEFYRYAALSIEDHPVLPDIVDVPDKCIISDRLVDIGFNFRFNTTHEVVDGVEERL
ncbi:NAD-dependent epimerase/dehydratase family protein [Vibrio sp.]|nr:NAD-dependent epimerase/dehydratase family protein [Vibrio sp.]